MFYELMQSQTQTIMLARARFRVEYIFKVIDPPVVPEEKEQPKRSQIVFLGVFLGMFFGVFCLLIRHYSLDSRGGK